ncbi:MAG: CAP domain-containing protein, partial [Deltaproteobacteria bacterium]|nr:CAP domain-containing protein [Deltaproteobacteria bacterium]
SPEGDNPVDRLQRAGIGDMHLAAENLGKTTQSNPSAEIVESWLRSPDHRGNLLAPALNFTGIGIARGIDGSLIYTEVYILVPR